MSTNGERALEKRLEQKKELREHDSDLSQQEIEIREAFNSGQDDDDALIRELLSNEDLTAGSPEQLQEETVAKLENLLSRDWVVANLTDAQEHDIRHKLEVMKIKIQGLHPPQESYVTGDLRAFLMDDKDENLQPLTSEERILIDELFETLKARITRGRHGFERELLETSIARSETEGDDQSDESGGLSLW